MNIGSFVTRCAKRYPDRLAVIHGNKRLDWARFNSRVNRLANAMVRLDIKKGENIALLQYNCPEMLESMFACFKAGLGAVPVNFRLHPKEFSHIINDARCRVVIHSPEFDESIVVNRDLMPNVEKFITLSEEDGPFINYNQLLNAASDEFREVDVRADDVAWIFYTSGTTGRPKGAMLTHRNLLCMSLIYYADYGFLGPGDAILHAAPLSHGSGLYSLPNIAKGATNVILDSKSFDAERVFWSIDKFKITNMFVAPTMLKLMVESPSLDRNEFSHLKSLIYGGGPTHVEDLKKAVSRLGGCLTQLYGMGETPMTISYLPHEDHIVEGDSERVHRLASAGIQRTGVNVKIVDGEHNELRLGEKGEVVVRSDVVMKGYWANTAATEETLRNGWLKTGDIGYMDEYGYLFLLDRSKDMIISGGENIYPREVEEVLIRHPAVREVAVIGVPDSKWGEAVKAIVSLVPNRFVEERELIDFCKASLASYKKPKSIEFVGDLPKNNFGKVMKRELRAKYLEKMKT